MFRLNITAELGTALAVVKVTPPDQREQPIFGGLTPKTIGAIKIQSGTNDYIGEGNPHAKFGNIYKQNQCDLLR